MELYYDSFKLDPVAVFLTAIDAMCEFGDRGWNDAFITGLRIWAVGYTSEIIVDSSEGPDGPFPLRASHAVLALYQMIVEMSAAIRFSEVTAMIHLGGRQIGSLRLQRLSAPVSDHDPSNSSLDLTQARITNVSVGSGPSGTVQDREHPDFTIAYTYTGAKINSKDIFLAVLDALSLIAEHDIFSPCTTPLKASSRSYKCEISITAIALEFQINYSFLLKGLRILIWDVFMHYKRFGELTFEFKWKGIPIGKGQFTPVPASKESDLRVAVAK